VFGAQVVAQSGDAKNRLVHANAPRKYAGTSHGGLRHSTRRRDLVQPATSARRPFMTSVRVPLLRPEHVRTTTATAPGGATTQSPWSPGQRLFGLLGGSLRRQPPTTKRPHRRTVKIELLDDFQRWMSSCSERRQGPHNRLEGLGSERPPAPSVSRADGPARHPNDDLCLQITRPSRSHPSV
jgi:hypothetical protein